MPLFSQRRGLTPVRKKIQIDSIDNELKNRLWSSIKEYWYIRHRYADKVFRNMMEKLWDSFFKLPLDTLPWDSDHTIDFIRSYFFNPETEWYRIYDIIEFLINICPYDKIKKGIIDNCNKVLEEEFSAYRFVGGRITPITSEEEISEIEDALAVPLDTVKTHINTALDMLSERKKPDYRNSIKESISGVEAICRLVTGNEKATLGQCIKKIETRVDLHPALKGAFSRLYGYTSSADGIRHALLDKSTPSYEDAKFMLVSCSAFINYLISKASKAGIDL